MLNIFEGGTTRCIDYRRVTRGILLLCYDCNSI